MKRQHRLKRFQGDQPMSNDNPTRIIRPNAPSGSEEGNATRAIGRGETSLDASPHDTEPKTRMISGFSKNFDDAPTAADAVHELAVGWLVVVNGPGRGCSREIYYGMNSVGRSPDERISIDFGDTSISREAHAYIVYDEKQADFYIQHGGKSNLVRLNGSPVLAPQPLKHGDRIEMGKSELLFIPLCGESFNWDDTLQE
ncbi:MAG: FHA domain-containing protein [Ahrensia sp.]